MRLCFHLAVRREVSEICDWYDERHDGLGNEFFQEVERVLNVISSHPTFFSPHTRGRRKAPLKRFPYGIYYRILDDRIRVLAICHDKRDPNYGAHRR